jgi:hypothetical protein
MAPVGHRAAMTAAPPKPPLALHSPHPSGLTVIRPLVVRSPRARLSWATAEATLWALPFLPPLLADSATEAPVESSSPRSSGAHASSGCSVQVYGSAAHYTLNLPLTVACSLRSETAGPKLVVLAQMVVYFTPCPVNQFSRSPTCWPMPSCRSKS